MKVPGTYKRQVVADGRELIEAAYERGRKVGRLETAGHIMAIVFTARPDAYEDINREVVDWVKAHTGETL